jgi:hypothetical protein
MSKEKGKSHPFAGHLNETEEILWMSAQVDTTLWVALKKSFPILVMIPFIFVIGMIIDAVFKLVFKSRSQISDTFYLVLVFSIVMTFFMMLWFNVKEGRSARVYAVTNERLLYRDQQAVMTWPLEEIVSISVIHDGQESLSFGPLYPLWLNIDDATAVKQIIEDARDQRDVNAA